MSKLGRHNYFADWGRWIALSWAVLQDPAQNNGFCVFCFVLVLVFWDRVLESGLAPNHLWGWGWPPLSAEITGAHHHILSFATPCLWSWGWRKAQNLGPLFQLCYVFWTKWLHPLSLFLILFLCKVLDYTCRSRQVSTSVSSIISEHQ